MTEAGSNNSNKQLLESMYANEHKVNLKLLSVAMHCTLKGLHSHFKLLEQVWVVVETEDSHHGRGVE